MSQSETKEIINDPILFNIDDIDELRETFINCYFDCYFKTGSPPTAILVPEKLSRVLESKWRLYTLIPSKWEHKVKIEESVNDLVFLTPQKTVYVVPVVLPTKNTELCLGFILGNPANLLKEY